VAKQFTLAKNERLKSRKMIDQLFSTGQRFALSPFKVFFAFTNDVAVQAGVGVSSRHFKKAVDRNKIKRMTRESYRLQKLMLQEQLNQQHTGLKLFILYTGKEIPEYAQVHSKLGVILKQLMQLINENISSHT